MSDFRSSAIAFCLAINVACSSYAQLPGHMKEEDDPNGYRFACGPLSLYAALLAAGVPVEFDEVIRSSKFEREKGVEIANLCAATKVLCPNRATCGRISPTELRSHLEKRGTAVLFVRTDSSIINHAVAATGTRTVNGATWITVVDYPLPPQEQALSQFVPVWDGDALLVKSSVQEGAMSRLELALWLLFPIFVATNGLVLLFKARRPRSS